MSFIGNLLWIVLGGGIFVFFFYLVGGLALCLTVVGIPFGVQCFKLAMLGLMPFGRKIVEAPNASGCLAVSMNIIWIFVGGIELALTHIIFGLLSAVTIVGLPFARQHAKLAALCLVPFGKSVV
ncbi:MAG: YccF domain-containing protein [Bacillota bacterium]|jgi:uncharacterized membrane protein YccF (DUF307 family)